MLHNFLIKLHNSHIFKYFIVELFALFDDILKLLVVSHEFQAKTTG